MQRVASRWLSVGVWMLLTLVSGADPVLTGLKVDTLLQNGPSNRKIDIVFCGDGYMGSQRKELRATVEAFLQALWMISPYKELKSEFNVYLVYLDAHPGDWIQGKRVGTFLLGSSKEGNDLSDVIRLKYPARAKAVVANAPACDVSIVVTKLEGRSHAGDPMVFTEKARQIFAHELGHRVGKLGDEYQSTSLLIDREQRPLPKKGDLNYPNLTLSAFIDPLSSASIKKTAKWGHLLDLPDGDVVSAYQGGYYREVGVWRPAARCLMAEIQYPDFCPVCHESLYQEILKRNGKSFDHDSYHRKFPLKGWRHTPRL